MQYYMPAASSIGEGLSRNYTPDASPRCVHELAQPQCQSTCEWTTEVSTSEPRFDHNSHGSFAAEGLKVGRHD